MYKGKRYNFIVICLLMVISIVAGTSMGFAFNSASHAETDLPNEVAPPTISAPSSKQTFGGLTQPSATASPINRILYAIAVIEYGEGYTSDSYFDLDFMGNKQLAKHKRYRGGGYNMLEEWFLTTGVVSFVGQDLFTGYLSDGKDYNYLRIENKSGYNYNEKTYNHAKGSKSVVDEQEFLIRRSNLPLNNFFFSANSQNTEVISDDKGRGKDHYTIRASIDGRILMEQYLAAVQNYAAVKVGVGSSEITFKIDKQTGFLLSYELRAVFNAEALGIKGSATLRLQETYTSVNLSAEKEITTQGKKRFGLT